MTTYDATGNVRQPTFEEIRHLFLAVTKDGEPIYPQPDFGRKDPRYPEFERITRLRKLIWEIYRDIICVASTGIRYSDLEKSSRMILSATKFPSVTFQKQFKAFLQLVSIHTYATPRRSDPEKRPILRLTEEFWSKEWVQRVFEKLKDLDSPKRTRFLLGDVYQAMVDGGTGRFVSKKTKGVDVITYIAMNNPRWDREKMKLKEIAKELEKKGFGWILKKIKLDKGPNIFDLIRKAISQHGQTYLYFVSGEEEWYKAIQPSTE